MKPPYVVAPFPLSIFSLVRCLFCFRGFRSLEAFNEHHKAMHS